MTPFFIQLVHLPWLWNPYRRVHLKTYSGLGQEVLDVAGSSDNSLILAGGRDKQPTVFDVESGKMVKRWQSHGGAVNAVAFNEDSSVAILAGQDGLVCCHDVRSRGPPIQVLDEARDGVLCLDANASEIVTGSADGNVRLYDLREGRLFIDYMKDSVISVHLTADNQCFFVASMGGTIRLIEKTNGQLLADKSAIAEKGTKLSNSTMKWSAASGWSQICEFAVHTSLQTMPFVSGTRKIVFVAKSGNSGKRFEMDVNNDHYFFYF
ncbi:hypothetical protein niasHT_036631 [Heterodera trifolii]|uniref:WD repeat domain-containing protein 83 n=1 Tax=Heterodera trifolii TaxID=157864 RepID=A0ABD2HYN6_9BILA